LLQRAEPYGLETQFLGWFLNRTEFLACAGGAGLELMPEFVMMDETPAHGAPEQATYQDFLFRRAYNGGLGRAERPVKPPSRNPPRRAIFSVPVDVMIDCAA
jgi:hypothetical protein